MPYSSFIRINDKLLPEANLKIAAPFVSSTAINAIVLTANENNFANTLILYLRIKELIKRQIKIILIHNLRKELIKAIKCKFPELLLIDLIKNLSCDDASFPACFNQINESSGIALDLFAQFVINTILLKKFDNVLYVDSSLLLCNDFSRIFEYNLPVLLFPPATEDIPPAFHSLILYRKNLRFECSLHQFINLIRFHKCNFSNLLASHCTEKQINTENFGPNYYWQFSRLANYKHPDDIKFISTENKTIFDDEILHVFPDYIRLIKKYDELFGEFETDILRLKLLPRLIDAVKKRLPEIS